MENVNELDDIRESVKSHYLKKFGNLEGFVEWFDCQTAWLMLNIMEGK